MVSRSTGHRVRQKHPAGVALSPLLGRLARTPGACKTGWGLPATQAEGRTVRSQRGVL